MSRLDSFIRRMSAQRDILNAVAADVASLDGPIIEFGLGNGRTWHHLRELFPDRRIIAFDRTNNAFARARPDDADFVAGEIRETAPRFAGIGAVLVHSDIATGLAAIDDVTTSWLAAITVPLLRPGGFAASGIRLEHPELEPLDLPPGIRPGRYFLYRRR